MKDYSRAEVKTSRLERKTSIEIRNPLNLIKHTQNIESKALRWLRREKRIENSKILRSLMKWHPEG